MAAGCSSSSYRSGWIQHIGFHQLLLSIPYKVPDIQSLEREGEYVIRSILQRFSVNKWNPQLETGYKR